MVQLMGLEPIRECSHYPLKVARLPIPPQLHIFCFYKFSEKNNRDYNKKSVVCQVFLKNFKNF